MRDTNIALMIMKKLIPLILLSLLALSSCTNHLPKSLGDFSLGESMSSVEAKLASKRIIKVEKNYFQEYTYHIRERDNGAKTMDIYFPESSPYQCMGFGWTNISILFSPDNKAYYIQLSQADFYDYDFANEVEMQGMSQDRLRNVQISVDRMLYSKYAKYLSESKTSQGSTISTYEDDEKSIEIDFELDENDLGWSTYCHLMLCDVMLFLQYSF